MKTDDKAELKLLLNETAKPFFNTNTMEPILNVRIYEVFRRLCPRRHSEVAHLPVNPLLSSSGWLIFFQALLMGGGVGGCLKEKGGLFNLAKCINGSKVSPARTCGYRALYYFF